MPDKYAVHTSATQEQVGWLVFLGAPDPKIQNEGDCFYGWGEPYDWRKGCIKHTLIHDIPLAEAQRWARELIKRGHQAVVTANDDWSVVITDARTPIHYKAEHVH